MKHVGHSILWIIVFFCFEIHLIKKFHEAILLSFLEYSSLNMYGNYAPYINFFHTQLSMK